MKPPHANASVIATFLVLILVAGVIYVFWQKTQPPLPAPGTVINSVVSPPESVIDSTLAIPGSLSGEPEATLEAQSESVPAPIPEP